MTEKQRNELIEKLAASNDGLRKAADELCALLDRISAIPTIKFVMDGKPVELEYDDSEDDKEFFERVRQKIFETEDRWGKISGNN